MKINNLTIGTNYNYNKAQVFNGGKNEINKVANATIEKAQIEENVKKVVSKINHISKIIGISGKTLQPICIKLEDFVLKLSIDKTVKNKIKILLTGNGKHDNRAMLFNPNADHFSYISKLRSGDQTLKMTIDAKDGRMIVGELDTFLACGDFIRNTITGKRRTITGNQYIDPHSELSPDKICRLGSSSNDREANVIGTTLVSLFYELQKVKPNFLLK